MDNTIIVAIIRGAALVLAALIPSLIGFWSAKRAFDKQKTMDYLLRAYKDLLFMNQLEREYVKNNKALLDESFKNRLRENAKNQLGYDRSDKAFDSYLLPMIQDLEAKSLRRSGAKV